MALSALCWPRVASPALPPPSADAPAPRNEPGKAGPAAAGNAARPAADGEAEQGIGWTFPPIRWGGSLSYDIRKDAGEGRTMMQKGMMVTVNAATDTWIWQPWFAQVKGLLGVTTSSNSMKRTEIDFGENSGNKSVVWTGNGQLSVLPQSRFPFEAHFEKADSSISNDNIVAGTSYDSSRFGFTQHYLRQEGDAMMGWERTQQNADASGHDRQDSLQLMLSHSMENQRLQFNGNHAFNKHDMTGESTVQNNLALQHSYSPIGTVSVESMVNVSRSGYHLQQGENSTQLNQVSSLAFWRPEERPMTVTAGVRALTLAADTTGFGLAGATSSARIRNANANVGMTYDLTKFLHFNAAANANQNTSTSTKSTTSSEMAGLVYQPDPIPLGGFQYNWTTSGTAQNRTGGQDIGRQLTLQLSHSLSRTFKTGEESNLSIEASQGISAAVRNGGDGGTVDGSAPKMLTHSGSIGWSMNGEGGSAMVRLSASDSRALGGNREFFQMVNLQAYSNLPTGAYSSWNGNLTVQAVRQGSALQIGSLDPNALDPNSPFNASNLRSVVVTSTGSLTYQHQRAFGVRRLRFTSDVRLNSQALLPLLAGPKDQETAAWENRFDYFIGRTQLRMSILYARTKGLNTIRQVDDSGHVIAESGTRVNKSIMFTVTRSFGDF